MKNIWIINHNATPPSLAGLCRHYYFSKYLSMDEYNVRILTASTIHNTNINMITGKEQYCEKDMDGVPYTFLRCSKYSGNGLSRIKNMLEFPVRIWRVYKKFEKPEVILASSPDPLSAFSALLLAKWLKIPSLLEIRDLWPESIVCYEGMSPRNPIIVALRILEKWMYKHCDRLIFTIGGGYDYIKDRGWDKQIPQDKVFHLNNGVDLEEFDANKDALASEAVQLSALNRFTVVYAGSIRAANNVELLLEAASELTKRGNKTIQFVVYGDGDYLSSLKERAEKEQLYNIEWKGRVAKATLPFILSRCGCSLLIYQHHDIWKYGGSQNKLFEYLAGGRPVVTNLQMGYCLIKKYHAGISLQRSGAVELADALESMSVISRIEYEQMGKNARHAAEEYDYQQLTNRLKTILEGV